jgi:hypothetical protein
MKTTQYIIFGIMLTSLIACGPTPGGSKVGERSIVLRYLGEPLDPEAANIKTLSGQPKNHFYPNDVLTVFWAAALRYSDDQNESPPFTETYFYDANLFLSYDNRFQSDIDFKLASIECALPYNSKYPCGTYASVACTYAKDNENTFICTTYPAGVEKRLDAVVVDFSTFITEIPAVLNVIARICPIDGSSCDEAVFPIQLN